MFFFLQFVALSLIVFLNFFIWGLYSVALPSTAQDATRNDTALAAVIGKDTCSLALFLSISVHSHSASVIHRGELTHYIKSFLCGSGLVVEKT